jgi:hypothetical protein
MLQVTEAQCLGKHRLWLAFNDGQSGEVDLTDILFGPVFEPLLDEKLFASLRVDSLLQTVVWENGADLAPEFLLERLMQGKMDQCSAPASAQL